jgi:hypothetical protein
VFFLWTARAHYMEDLLASLESAEGRPDLAVPILHSLIPEIDSATSNDGAKLSPL